VWSPIRARIIRQTANWIKYPPPLYTYMCILYYIVVHILIAHRILGSLVTIRAVLIIIIINYYIMHIISYYNTLLLYCCCSCGRCTASAIVIYFYNIWIRSTDKRLMRFLLLRRHPLACIYHNIPFIHIYIYIQYIIICTPHTRRRSHNGYNQLKIIIIIACRAGCTFCRLLITCGGEGDTRNETLREGDWEYTVGCRLTHSYYV